MNLGYNFKRLKISSITLQEPIIVATLIGKDGEKINVTAVLDTGSDFVLLPFEIAKLLKLDLNTEKKEFAKTYSGEPLATTLSKVRIKIEKGREKIEFVCKCAVSLNEKSQHENIIFGASFLQNFKVLFDYPANRFYIKK